MTTKKLDSIELEKLDMTEVKGGTNGTDINLQYKCNNCTVKSGSQLSLGKQ